ncbi:holo-(acyl-carrier-protein) synthase [Thermovirga lienii DSM 17291]|jgi:holo-[acyl-carrier protein] synthase|uniref:Holo-[acyl-carrier-protein] synthase n=1 Tax=Thermovirga lienii (strain ATCC BAA-1197 / DSM 17291 / Cas60314) TaxID=580340 RepID=G7V9X9_THELD|nr:holo-ACP synthase [Thermovirga lienii]AER66679.1 holo-(acyl-carrier-protein) synthase [Thermovirga lienii DSM 17291]KUK42731.1 MAG: Holo-[acyl-carrier-protein] synthase [Thermovirga lienii]MDN5318499.1 holo-[acyl-carrier protein] synthase [Thermovirga sp.]MDN5367897.1 holo-[acyl-carrier protein] synthase [Thermovirga sp.]
MIVKGIGVDICSISRIGTKIKNDEFKRRVFTEEEITYAEGHVTPEVHYASSFAAKEAFAKATRLGLGKVGLKNVWVKRTEKGPILSFSSSIRDFLKKEKMDNVHVSLSHDGGFAVAFVVIEGRE